MTDEKRPGKYPVELRDRAVRMVFEAEQHCDSQWEAVVSVAEKLGPTAETVRKWVRRVEIDEGRKPGLRRTPTKDDGEEIRRYVIESELYGNWRWQTTEPQRTPTGRALAEDGADPPGQTRTAPGRGGPNSEGYRRTSSGLITYGLWGRIGA